MSESATAHGSVPEDAQMRATIRTADADAFTQHMRDDAKRHIRAHHETLKAEGRVSGAPEARKDIDSISAACNALDSWVPTPPGPPAPPVVPRRWQG